MIEKRPISYEMNFLSDWIQLEAEMNKLDGIRSTYNWIFKDEVSNSNWNSQMLKSYINNSIDVKSDHVFLVRDQVGITNQPLRGYVDHLSRQLPTAQAQYRLRTAYVSLYALVSTVDA